MHAYLSSHSPECPRFTREHVFAVLFRTKSLALPSFVHTATAPIAKGFQVCKLISLSWYRAQIVFLCLTGAPFVHTIHFPTSKFRWTHKQPNDNVLDSFVPPTKPYKTRYRCKNCGACVASKNNLAGKTSILGTHLERDKKGALVHWDDLKPTAHIYYDTHVMVINDELGKWTGYEDESEQICTEL